MSRQYIKDQMSRALHRVVHQAFGAPLPRQAPMIDSPGTSQSITDSPYPRQLIDYSQAGPVLDLVEQMHERPAVAQIPVRQPGYILRAAPAPVGAKTVVLPDQRMGCMQYPENGARESYVYGPMKAPARLQSVPGYVIKQTTINRNSPGYPTQAMRAPRPRSGGGGCRE